MHSFPKASPEAMGISSERLLQMMKKLAELEYLNSIIILRKGHAILECWQSPYERETPHQLFSLSKSFTSTAIGFAVQEGLLQLTDKVISFFPEKLSCAPCTNMQKMEMDVLKAMTGI